MFCSKERERMRITVSSSVSSIVISCRQSESVLMSRTMTFNVMSEFFTVAELSERARAAETVNSVDEATVTAINLKNQSALTSDQLWVTVQKRTEKDQRDTVSLSVSSMIVSCRHSASVSVLSSITSDIVSESFTAAESSARAEAVSTLSSLHISVSASAAASLVMTFFFCCHFWYCVCFCQFVSAFSAAVFVTHQSIDSDQIRQSHCSDCSCQCHQDQRVKMNAEKNRCCKQAMCQICYVICHCQWWLSETWEKTVFSYSQSDCSFQGMALAASSLVVESDIRWDWVTLLQRESVNVNASPLLWALTQTSFESDCHGAEWDHVVWFLNM